MSKKTIFVALFIMLQLVFGAGVKAEAAVLSEQADINLGGGITVKSVNAKYMNVNFSVNSIGNSTSNVSVFGNANTTKISVTARLQWYNALSRSWENVTQWTETTPARTLTLNKSYTVSRHGSYRLSVTATVYSSSGKETTSQVSPTSIY